MPEYPRQSDESPHGITQRMLAGVEAQVIHIRDMTQIGSQTVMAPPSRPHPTGIPDNIPLRGAAHFVGRQEVLETLHRELRRNDRVSIAALAGMGGIGKTELAVHYARQHLADYPGGVCWLHAQTGDLSAQVLAYAQHTLGLDVPQELHAQPLTLEQQLQWCWHYWEPAGRVLLVLDDVTDLPACQPIFLAPPERFRIVLTTRRRGLDPGFVELSLDVLSPDDARILLAALVGQEPDFSVS